MSAVNLTNIELDSAGLRSFMGLDGHSSLESLDGAIEWLYPRLIWTASSMQSGFQALPGYLNWSTALNIALLLLIAANAKCIPLVYHLRILNGVRHMLRSQRPPRPLTPEQLFQPLITSSRAPLMEIDVFGHKNNNTYFTDHDVARTHLLSTMFATGIEKWRGSIVMNGLSGKKRSNFTIPLGAVCCSFRKELKPYEAYDIWTRILSWDHKWIYIVSHFVKKGAKVEPDKMTLYPRQNSTSGVSRTSRQSSVSSLGATTPRGSVDETASPKSDNGICASALSKLVFKDGRVTIAPEVMLEMSGLLPPKATREHHGELRQAQVKANDEASPIEAAAEVEKVEDSDSSSDSGCRSARRSSRDNTRADAMRQAIEAERVRGLRLAEMLAGQTDLEFELQKETALGRHFDGHGIEGVVTTLLQLGKLSSYQLL